MYTIFGIDVVIIASVSLVTFACAFTVPFHLWSRKVVKIAAGKLMIGNYDLKKGGMVSFWMLIGYFYSAALLITSPNAPELLRLFCWWHVISYALYVPGVWLCWKRVVKMGKEDCGNVNFNPPKNILNMRQ